MIHQVEPWITESDVRAVTQYLQSGGWVTEFELTRTFERELGALLSIEHVIVVPSGTVALYLSLLALGIGPGDVVLVPDYTMIASANAVRWTGADVVCAEVRSQDLLIDLEQLEVPKRARALMYVAINGRTNNLSDARGFCDEHGLFLIEDACQALGSTHRGACAGSVGDIGALSFTPHKLITTGQGGAVVTRSSRLAKQVRGLKDFCRVRPGLDEHYDVGFNFKFTDLQAALGLSQLQTFEERVDRKRRLVAQYREALRDVDDLEVFTRVQDDTVPWFAEVLVRDAERRDALAQGLASRGIRTRPFYPPVHSQRPYRSSQTGAFPVARSFAARGLWLPSSLTMTEAQIAEVVDAVRGEFGSP